MAKQDTNNVASLGGRKDTVRDNKYGINLDDIKLDLTPGKGRPEWIFSCYSPVRNAPVQLLGGPQREQSFEEMRTLHYAAAAAGNAQQAVQDAMRLYAETEAQMQAILNDTDGAVRYILEGENTHPNRNDIIEGKTGPAATQTPFGQPSGLPQPSATTGFGQPSTTTGFGQPPATTAFGQPSTTTAFGQPSALGQGATPSPFGQPSAVGQQTAFGKPSFGQPTAFGQPSALGAAVQPSPFGQPSKPAPAFGQSPFAQAAQTQPNPLGGGFGQPSTSPFGQVQPQAQQPSPFGQPSTQQPQQPSPFGRPQPQAQQQNPFGQPQQQQATTTPFGQPTPAPNPLINAQPTPFTSNPPTQSTTQQNPFSAPSVPQSTAKILKPNASLPPLPPLQGQTTRDPRTNRLLTWKGQAVKYIDNEPAYQHPNDAGTFVHIYFPDGPPQPEALKDAVGKDEDYTKEIEEAYRFVREAGGRFKEGAKVPEVPPRGEWCVFDF
ncbi:hypothetical protein AJ79_01697 [Helicocarpus griseus UAMH5409]|uniref:CCCH zinc finger domain-containing protein n=1 Tax=Helicocarpus griseus UAMH5409 TaxID=1447875 RepID=A0A2B7Y6F2_9EURO|nr:hypothetical protein AJ79_01697 [Helicocarpus griseus UAMH5409]